MRAATEEQPRWLGAVVGDLFLLAVHLRHAHPEGDLGQGLFVDDRVRYRAQQGKVALFERGHVLGGGAEKRLPVAPKVTLEGGGVVGAALVLGVHARGLLGGRG